MRDNGSDRLTYLLIGAGIGAALAMLFTPKSGPELRRGIADATRRGYRRGSEKAGELRDKATSGVHAVREEIERQKHQLGHAIEAGKQAYREERTRTEA